MTPELPCPLRKTVNVFLNVHRFPTPLPQHDLMVKQVKDSLRIFPQRRLLRQVGFHQYPFAPLPAPALIVQERFVRSGALFTPGLLRFPLACASA
jgi:hypothetical protein